MRKERFLCGIFHIPPFFFVSYFFFSLNKREILKNKWKKMVLIVCVNCFFSLTSLYDKFLKQILNICFHQHFKLLSSLA